MAIHPQVHDRNVGALGASDQGLRVPNSAVKSLESYNTIVAACGHLLEQAGPAFVADAAGRLLHTNKAFAALLPAMTDAGLVVRDESPRLYFVGEVVEQASQRRSDSEGRWQEAAPLLLAMGPEDKQDLYTAKCFLLLDESGQVVVVAGLLSPSAPDSTIAEEIRRTQERFDDVARLVSDWIWEVDGELRLIFVSNRVTEALGFHPRAMIGRHLNDLIGEGASLPNELSNPHARRPFRDIELRFRHADGGARLFRFSGVPVFEPESGAHRGFRGTAQDITDLRARETALESSRKVAESANRAKSEFLATMSHELRTPLNAIIGFSELMQREAFGSLGNANYKDYVRDIYQCAIHLLELINDILDVSKIEAGRMELNEEEVDVVNVIQSAFRLVRERAAENDVKLTLALSERTPNLAADTRAVKQVLLNLLSNAVKFTPAGGSVVVNTAIDERGDFLIRVKDTGIGMAPDEVAIALTPFGQVESSLSRRYEGTGLGLSLSKGLIELHGGKLEIDSEPNNGTCVTVRFPASRIAQA